LLGIYRVYTGAPRGNARVLLCCYLVLCGIPLPGFTGQADRIDRPDNVLEITYGPATPAWVPPADAGKTYLIIGGGVRP
jgi:hypothetical protein